MFYDGQGHKKVSSKFRKCHQTFNSDIILILVANSRDYNGIPLAMDYQHSHM